MHTRQLLLLLVGVQVAVPVAAQEATSMTVAQAAGTYSHRVDVQASLQRTSDNNGVEGVNVSFWLRDDADSINVDLGTVPTDSAGMARLQVPLVNGCSFLGNAVLAAGPTTMPQEYILEARFTGGDDVHNIAHDPSTGTSSLRITRERAEVAILRGTSGTLGDMLTVEAKIVDPDGDAPCDRSAATGSAATTVAGHRLAFFMDVTGDQDYSDPREALGSAVTSRPDPNSDATASITTDLTPVGNQPRAGVLENALQVQLPADDTLYLPATARGRLILEPAPVDPLQASLTADPASPKASGDPVTLTIILRDKFGNALGLDAPAHAVTVVVVGDALGASLTDPAAVRDSATGKYAATLKPTTRGGKVTVRVDVDGTAGSTHDITFSPFFPIGPCACSSLPSGNACLASIPLLACLWLLRRRGRTS